MEGSVFLPLLAYEAMAESFFEDRDFQQPTPTCFINHFPIIDKCWWFFLALYSARRSHGSVFLQGNTAKQSIVSYLPCPGGDVYRYRVTLLRSIKKLVTLATDA